MPMTAMCFQEKVAAQMSREEAVRLIQRQERARQGRHRARFMQEIYRQEMREKTKGKVRDRAAAGPASCRRSTDKRCGRKLRAR